jgi:hypothetical protein
MKRYLLYEIALLLLLTVPAIAQESPDSSSSDSALVLLPWERFAETYFLNLSPTKPILRFYPETHMLTYEFYKDNVFLDFHKIESMSDFMKHYAMLSTRKLLFEQTEKAVQSKGAGYGQGLVPDIDLPKIKTPISGIIGEGGKLAVQGSEKIDFGGSQSRTYDKIHRPNESTSLFPELKMKQILNVKLQGTVGQKINVFIDHNSEAESDLQNKIKLQYKGEEDEIIQLIEAGDTDLSLPGTKVIGAPPAYKGLFGIKSVAKVGPLDITAVASKEQGESDQTQFVGQARQDTSTRYDIEYVRRQIFIFDELFQSGDEILNFNVYVDDGIYTNDTITVHGAAYLYADSSVDSLAYEGNFDKLVPSAEYEYFGNELNLNSSIYKEEVLAVRYVRKSGSTYDTVGYYRAQDSTWILKLIKPKYNRPSYPTWDYELKNRYYLGATKLPHPELITISIKKDNRASGIDSTTQGGAEYAQLLGIDGNGDGYVDREYIDNERGLVRFPLLHPPLYPFADSFVLDEPDSIIYDTTATDLGLCNYYMEFSYKGAQTMIFLGQLNIIEGSEVVKINGIPLQKDVDYIIDYNTGSVEFRGTGKELLSQPDAQLTIDYQYAPFFSTASKSLVGMRAEYNLSENNKLGTSWIYRNISTFDERPKLGQEPRSVVVGEIDGSITIHPNFLTTLVDKLPLVETEQPSQAKVEGVVAISMPDPNSTGEVYIDDMEGVKQTNDIGTSMWFWHYGSVPQQKDTTTFGRYYWYEPVRDEWIRKGDIFPNLPEDQRDDEISYLRIVFNPKNNDTASWMSMMNLLSRTGENLTKARFLELWVNGTRGTIHVDFGTNIPEDIPRRRADGTIAGYNGKIDTEDKNEDGLLDANEDTGLDGVQGTDSQNVPGDDGCDDYPQKEITQDLYKKLNGTEKNDRLDTEDLDRDGSLNPSSGFVEYELSLENPESTHVAEEHANGWRLFRIPLSDIDTTYGIMDWEYVKFVRLWIDGFSQPDSIHIYSMEITSTSWENMGITALPDAPRKIDYAAELFVTQKNTEENPDYSPPFDPGEDQYGRAKREQSLVLQYQDIPPKHRGSVFLEMTKPDDYTIYQEMKLHIKRNAGRAVMFYMRIGGDSTTYYEYTTTAPDQWEEITIPFKALTDLKLVAPPDSSSFRQGQYAFRNNPSLTNVKYLEMGFVNQDSLNATGELWIDEIRLTSPRRDKGTKMNLTANLQVADFMTLQGSVSQTDADFQQLNMNKVSQSNITDYQYSATLEVGKFFPKLWAFRIPLSHSENSSVGYPKYKTGSDVVLDEENAKREKTMNRSQSETIGFSKGSTSTNLIGRLFVDPIKLNAYNKNNYTLTPTTLDSTKNRGVTGNYSYNPAVKPLRIFNLFDLHYFPRSFGASSGYTTTWFRRFTKQQAQWTVSTHDKKRYLNVNKNLQYGPFAILTGSYSDDQTRDLDINYENDSLTKRLGEIVNLNKTFSSSFTPTIGDWSRPMLSFSTNYSEDRKPENRSMVEDSFPVRNVGNNNIVSLTFDVAVPKLLKMLTSIRDESKDSTAVQGSPHWIAMNIEKIANFISRPSVAMSRNRHTAYGLLKDQPDLEYQFGLRDGLPDDYKHPDPKQDIYSNDQKGVTDNFSTSTGLNTPIFNVNTTYTTNKSTSITLSSKQISRSTTWPDISLQFPKITKFLPQNSVLRTTSAAISFRKDRGSNEIVGSGIQTETKNQSWSPSVQMTWKRDIRTNISATFSENRSYNYSETYRETNAKTTGYNFSISYSFSAPTGLKFPLIGGKVSFSSNLDAGLDVNYSKSYAISSNTDGPTNHMINYLVSPRLSYNFSNNITGGLIGSYSVMNDKKQDMKTSTTGVDVWVEFKF